MDLPDVESILQGHAAMTMRAVENVRTAAAVYPDEEELSLLCKHLDKASTAQRNRLMREWLADHHADAVLMQLIGLNDGTTPAASPGHAHPLHDGAMQPLPVATVAPLVPT